MSAVTKMTPGFWTVRECPNNNRGPSVQVPITLVLWNLNRGQACIIVLFSRSILSASAGSRLALFSRYPRTRARLEGSRPKRLARALSGAAPVSRASRQASPARTTDAARGIPGTVLNSSAARGRACRRPAGLWFSFAPSGAGRGHPSAWGVYSRDIRAS